jgi:oligopeptide/dipeptide ABC transporter ATP-binding protein
VQVNLNLSRKEADKKVIEMFEMVQMPDPKRNFDNYPYELSGGMAQRVVISIALSMSPSLLLADEPTMGLDVTIQAQVLDLMAEMFKERKSAVLLATRDLGIVANYCNKVAVLCYGQLVEFTGVREFFENALHPYGKYLLKAAFASQQRSERIELEKAIETEKIMLTRSSLSCRFVDRCHLAKELCWTDVPVEKYVSPTRSVKCHYWESKEADGST